MRNQLCQNLPPRPAAPETGRKAPLLFEPQPHPWSWSLVTIILGNDITSHIGPERTPMTSFQLTHLCKDSFSRSRHILRAWRLGLPHMDFWGNSSAHNLVWELHLPTSRLISNMKHSYKAPDTQ